jgi:cystathionine beta-lyase
LFSVVFDPRFSATRVDAFCDALKLFKLGYSWGGPVSLVVPYDITTMRSARLGTLPHKGVLVRFSVGMEAVEDLRADLEQALAALA